MLVRRLAFGAHCFELIRKIVDQILPKMLATVMHRKKFSFQTIDPTEQPHSDWEQYRPGFLRCVSETGW